MYPQNFYIKRYTHKIMWYNNVIHFYFRILTNMKEDWGMRCKNKPKRINGFTKFTIKSYKLNLLINLILLAIMKIFNPNYFNIIHIICSKSSFILYLIIETFIALQCSLLRQHVIDSTVVRRAPCQYFR